MSFTVELIFGKDVIEKYWAGKDFTDYEKEINFKKYEFQTLQERNAFYKGIGETVGWSEYQIIKEMKLNKKDNVVAETNFDYCEFIQKYYPKYYSCNNVLLSDILTRKMNNEVLDIKDEEYIKHWNVREELMNIDKELLLLAFENFFNEMYPVD